jgi:hypothetical protein
MHQDPDLVRTSPPSLANLRSKVPELVNTLEVSKVAVGFDAVDKKLNFVHHATVVHGSGLQEFLKVGRRPLRLTPYRDFSDRFDTGCVDQQMHLVARCRLRVEILAVRQSDRHPLRRVWQLAATPLLAEHRHAKAVDVRIADDRFGSYEDAVFRLDYRPTIDDAQLPMSVVLIRLVVEAQEDASAAGRRRSRCLVSAHCRTHRRLSWPDSVQTTLPVAGCAVLQHIA